MTSTQTPPSELIARQNADYRGWLWVAPPRDTWLEAGHGEVWSADFDVVQAWRHAGRPAQGFLPPDSNLSSSLRTVPGAVLFWPKSHALGEWWLNSLNASLAEGTPIQIVGENQGGVRRVAKLLEAHDRPCRKLDTARRCTLFETRASGLAQTPESGWETFEVDALTLVSHPGVFGHGKLDDGTRLLLDALEGARAPDEPGRALDIGCGDGVLSAWMARRGHTVTATDINAFAVEATRRTLAANDLTGCVVQGDVFSGIHDRFETIVSNPPFHRERHVDYGPAQRLILEAPAYLEPGGTLTLVANAFLPYPDWLERAFGEFETLADNRRFRVYRATR